MKPNLAPPTGATRVDEWDTTGAAFRAFDGPNWTIEHTTDHRRRADIVVSVIGLQYADAHVERKVVIDCPDTPTITPAEARKLGSALIAAADAADG
jgi:hypothetical protein